MEKRRDWVDYANLASSVAQNVQLSGIAGLLDNLQRIEATKAYKEEAATKFRAILFRIEDEFNTVAERSNGAEAGKMQGKLLDLLRVEAKTRLWWWWAEAAVGEGRIPLSYEDKDRYAGLLKQIGVAVSEIEKRLPAEVITETRTAIDYERTLHTVKMAADYKHLQEMIRNAQNKAAGASSDRANTISPSRRGALISICLLAVAWVVLVWMEHPIFAFVVLIAGGAILLPRAIREDKKQADLDKMASSTIDHQDRIGLLAVNLPTPGEIEKYEDLAQSLGVDSAEGLLRIYEERRAFVERVAEKTGTGV